MTSRFASTCDELEAILSGTARRDIVKTAASATSFSRALSLLRDAMRSHVFLAGARRIALDELVRTFEQRTRGDGFHVLHDWDGTLEKLNDDTIPVDVLSFMMDKTVVPSAEQSVLRVLLDYYFMYVVALLTLRIWDEGDPDDNLERLQRLLEALQGASGSGQRFAASAEALMLVAISHYEPDEHAYDRLLGKLETLGERHRGRFARILAAIYGSHLRFGFEATYGRDIVTMRNDNGPDYPWLLFALVTLMSAYDGGDVRDEVVEGLANGLSPDPRAFVGKPPESLSSYTDRHSRFVSLFEKHRGTLLDEIEHQRPSTARYSPVAFYFNFLHNTLKAIVVDALLRGEPSRVAIDELLTGFPESESEPRETLARTLMGYARSSPDKIRGKWVPVIVYDPRKGRRAFNDMMRRLS